MRIIPILLITILLIGCTGGDGDSKSTEQFRVGTQALTMSFVQGQPPSRVIVQQGKADAVRVGIELRNLGAEPISGGVLYFSGFDPKLVSFEQSRTLPALPGKDAFGPQGGRDLIEISGDVNTAAIGEVYRPTFQATACYEYITRAQMPICIDPDPTSKDPKPCSASSGSAGGGQGAPLAVTAFQQEAAPGSTLIKITIKNVGAGDVFMGGYYKCAPGQDGLSFRDLDRISIDGVSIGGTSILGSCRGLANGQMTLTNKQGVMFCTFSSGTGSSYQSTLNVDMSYNYRQSVQKSIEIVKLS